MHKSYRAAHDGHTGPETKAKLCGLNEEKRKAAEGVPEWLIVTCASAPVCRIQGDVASTA